MKTDVSGPELVSGSYPQPLKSNPYFNIILQCRHFADSLATVSHEPAL
jgi:hypothetical protein